MTRNSSRRRDERQRAETDDRRRSPEVSGAPLIVDKDRRKSLFQSGIGEILNHSRSKLPPVQNPLGAFLPLTESFAAGNRVGGISEKADIGRLKLVTDGGTQLRTDVDEITGEELTRRRRASPLGTEKDREFRCPICEARCTEALSSSDEYGHLTDCPRRPDYLPRGGKKLRDTSHALATDGGDGR